MAEQALIDRLKRYSKHCLTQHTDPDFAEAVYEAVDVIDGLLNDLQDALDTVEELQSQSPKWIPVSERLPENDKTVLVWNRRNSREYFDICDHGRWIILEWEDITHWMPLPEPPKEETDG